MAQVFLGLGSNMGDRISTLQTAIEAIDQKIGKLKVCSSFYESEPWGFEADQWFVNCVVEVDSQLEPLPLLNKLQEIEKTLGRTREEGKITSRTIDIDILLYNCQLSIVNCQLTIPHPRMHLRKFVLMPLAEIAGDLIVPEFNKTVAQLLSECIDSTSVNQIVI